MGINFNELKADDQNSNYDFVSIKKKDEIAKVDKCELTTG